jgi:hypothetical protein
MSEFENFLSNPENVLAFAFWMNDRQTDDELDEGETIENNGIGWNKPDGGRVSLRLMSICQNERVSKDEILEFVDNTLRHVCSKYKRQWSEYSGKPYTISARPQHKVYDGPLCLVVDAKGKYLSGLKGSDPLWSKARSEAVVWPEMKAMEWVEENRAWRGLSMSDKKIIRIR